RRHAVLPVPLHRTPGGGLRRPRRSADLGAGDPDHHGSRGVRVRGGRAAGIYHPAHHAPTGVHPGVLYATAFTFLTGALHALSQPVRQAMVANTVPRHDLWNAIALNSIAGNMARVVGPALGGVLYAWLSAGANVVLQWG